MNEIEFREKWRAEEVLYKAWGGYVVETIKNELEKRNEDVARLFKIPPTFRVKTKDSLVDKAFYRSDKKYSDPYAQIEDKVGARFVVLFTEDIAKVSSLIEELNGAWEYDACRNYQEEREKEPLLFTYQSVHYILRPKSDIEYNGVVIPRSVACEVQIRTLLQHAHAELTHDAIYKSKKMVEPEVHRTVAKSMALIETTDDFFVDVMRRLNSGPLNEHCINDRLDDFYLEFIGRHANNQKSSIVIWDVFESLVDSSLIDNIRAFMKKNEFLSSTIKNNKKNVFYQQSVVLFVCYLLKHNKKRLLADWPLQREILEPLANDLGISLL